MLLYIGSYGLTHLRLYTLWFMFLLLIVFAVIVVWHIRSFNAGKPIALTCAGLVLILALTNTDGLIAKYNVEQYEAGVLKTVDTMTLATMSDAVLPYLRELRDSAPDAEMKTLATAAIRLHREGRGDMFYDAYHADESGFYGWNVPSALSGVDSVY
jgi:hypothetical protein